MIVDARNDGDADRFRVTTPNGEMISRVLWADTDTGELAAYRRLGVGLLVHSGVPFDIVDVSAPQSPVVASCRPSGEPRTRMRMHAEDPDADLDLRLELVSGERLPGVVSFDTEKDRVEVLLRDARQSILDCGRGLAVDTFHLPFRIVDSRDGSVVAVSESFR